MVHRAQNGEQVRLENVPFHVDRGNGEEHAWFTFTYSPVRDDKGKVGGVLCTVMETTGEMLAEVDRRRETARLRSLLHQTPKMVVMLRGPDHVFGLVNATYCDSLGRHDIIGRTIREVVPDIESNDYLALLDRVYQTGKPYVGRAVSFTPSAAAGQTPEQLYLDFFCQAITGEDGHISSIFVEGIDVTESVNPTRALQASQERLLFLNAIRKLRAQLMKLWGVMQATTCMLGQHLQAARCAFADVEDDNNRFTIRADWTMPGMHSSVGVYSLAIFGQRAMDKLHRGHSLVIHDVTQEIADVGAATFAAIGVQAIICCPLVRNRHLVAMMAMHHGQPRQWSVNEIKLMEDIWAAPGHISNVFELVKSCGTVRCIMNCFLRKAPLVSRRRT